MSSPASILPSVRQFVSPRLFVDVSEGTYAGELGAAVTALGDSAALLDVQKAQVTTGSLDDSGPVGPGVVAVITSASVPEFGWKACGADKTCDAVVLFDRGPKTHGLRRR